MVSVVLIIMIINLVKMVMMVTMIIVVTMVMMATMVMMVTISCRSAVWLLLNWKHLIPNDKMYKITRYILID